MLVKKIFMLNLLIMILSLQYSFCQDSTYSIKQYGPYHIGTFRQHLILVEVHSIEVKNSRYQWPKSDVSIVIKDQNSKILYQKNFPFTGENDYEIRPSIENIIDKGDCLGIVLEVLPSAPMYGHSVQYFGFNRLDQFVPITGLISSETNTIKKLKIDNEIRYVVEVDSWTGNYTVLEYCPIDFNGVIDDKISYIKLDQYPVAIDSVYAADCRNRFNPDTVWVMLFENPSEKQCNPEPVCITRQSKISFLYAKESEDHLWLCVIIDGKRGYIKDYDELSKLGLPMAG